MKNKTLPVVIGIILLLAIGGGAYVLKGKKSASPAPVLQTDSTDTASSEHKSLKDLLMANVPQTCTYVDQTEGSDTRGTTYIAGGKIRSDSDSIINDKTMSTHMIVDGNTSYTWTDGQNTGFKMTLNSEDFEKDESVGATTNPPTGRQTVNFNKVIDYKCGNWKVDNSMFTPPADISFTDFSTMVKPKGNSTSTPQGNSNSCSACDNLTDEAKTNCRTALKCD